MGFDANRCGRPVERDVLIFFKVVVAELIRDACVCAPAREAGGVGDGEGGFSV